MPKPYAAGRIALVRSRTGRLWSPPSENLDRAWRALAGGPFSVSYVRGSHVSVLPEPHVANLAQAVANCIAAANADLPGRGAPDR